MLNVYDKGKMKEMEFEEAVGLKDWDEYFEMLIEKAANAPQKLLEYFKTFLMENYYIKNDGNGNEGFVMDMGTPNKVIMTVIWIDNGGSCNLELCPNETIYMDILKKLEL